MYAGSRELMGRYAALAVDIGARIVGGYCGNTPSHVAAMRRALDAYKPSHAQTLKPSSPRSGLSSHRRQRVA